jgi:hypothetical protein
VAQLEGTCLQDLHAVGPLSRVLGDWDLVVAHHLKDGVGEICRNVAGLSLQLVGQLKRDVVEGNALGDVEKFELVLA